MIITYRSGKSTGLDFYDDTLHVGSIIYLQDGKIMDTLKTGNYGEDDPGSRHSRMKDRLTDMNF